MNRAVISRIARHALLPAIVLFGASGICFAQEAEVKAAIDAYHRAIESRDLSKIEPLWAHEGDIFLVNPSDKSISVGWDAVKKSWESTFEPIAELKLTQTDGPHIRVKDNIAWSMGNVTSDVKLKSGDTRSAPTFETDVFEKSGGKWLLVSHIASRVPK
jgi:ketosteroid isomerase-like protein